MAKGEFDEVYIKVLSGVVDGIMGGVGSNDREVEFELGKALTWSCCTNAMI